MATKEIIFTTRGARDLQAMFRSLRQEAAKMDKAFDKVGGSKARKADTSQSKRAANAKIADARRVEMANKRAARETANAAKRSSRAQITASKKASDQRIKDIKRASREQLKQDRMERRIASRRIAQQQRFERRMARIRRGQGSVFQDFAMGAGRRGGGLLRGAAGAFGLGGGALVAGGAFAVGSAARQGIALSDTARRLSRKGGGQVGANDLRKSFQQTALSVPGVKALDVARGTEAFVTKTGDVEAGQKFQKTFAEIGLATGTDIEEIAGAAADLFEKFDIKTVEGMRDAMAGLAIQGKRGAFELEDAASQFPKIAAAAAKFGLTGATGVTTLGGLTQIARQATPGGEEAATSVEQLFAQLIKKSDVIKKKTGQSVFKDKGRTQTNDITDVIVGTISGAGGNLKTLEDIFGTRGSRAISPLVSTFNRARQGATGTDAERDAIAMQALREQIERATDSSGALAELQRDLADAQGDSSSKITAAWENFVIQISNKALPGMLTALEEFSQFVSQTNFEGLGAAIATLAKVTVAAATAIGLIAPKTAGEQALTAEAEQVDAIEKGNKALAAKVALRANIAGRGTPATPEELSTLKTLDESISLSGEASSIAGAQATSAKRLDSGADIGGTFLGASTTDIRNRVAQDAIGGQFVAGEIESSGGVGAFDKIAADATRSLGAKFKTVDAPLDNFAQAVLLATETLNELARAQPAATVIQPT